MEDNKIEESKKVWKELQKELELKATAGEKGMYYGFFLHGWVRSESCHISSFKSQLIERIEERRKEFADFNNFDIAEGLRQAMLIIEELTKE